MNKSKKEILKKPELIQAYEYDALNMFVKCSFRSC